MSVGHEGLWVKKIEESSTASQNWEFWAEARNERRARMGSLCERRGRHVTRSFCRPCRHPPAFPFGRFKEPPFRFNFAHPPLPVQVPKKLR